VQGQVVVMVAVGLFVALLVTAEVWARTAKRRDASRLAARSRRRRARF